LTAVGLANKKITNLMKYKYLAVMFFCVAHYSCSFGQMEAAQKMNWDYDTTVTFKKSVPVLWDAIKDPAQWAAFSNGYITSINVKGETAGQRRELFFADGSKRKDQVVQYQPEYKFIVLKITDPVPSGVTDNTFAVTAATEGEGISSLHFMLRAEGDEQQKSVLVNAVKKEIVQYIEGLRKAIEGK
jgi:hypothetical protein